jgi:hypothetical protein
LTLSEQTLSEQIVRCSEMVDGQGVDVVAESRAASEVVAQSESADVFSVRGRMRVVGTRSRSRAVNGMRAGLIGGSVRRDSRRRPHAREEADHRSCLQ